jgi:predicted amino acid racemase
MARPARYCKLLDYGALVTAIMLPELLVNLRALSENTKRALASCRQHGLSLAAVTKGCAALPEVAQVLLDGGADFLADSRSENLARLGSALGDDCPPRILLRLPAPSRAREVVAAAEFSLNSEGATLEALSFAALDAGKTHGVILMVELGDLREGGSEEETLALALSFSRLPGLRLAGLGANFGCLSGVLPSRASLDSLVAIAGTIEGEIKRPLGLVSIGGSVVWHLLEGGGLPAGITQLRLGELILLGRETAFGGNPPGFRTDAFTLVAEVIERKRKASAPTGEIGMDAFGKRRRFEDRGPVERALLALGRQEVDPAELRPRMPGVRIVGASSDHLALELEGDARRIAVGDAVEFDLSYGALLSLSSSRLVDRRFPPE